MTSVWGELKVPDNGDEPFTDYSRWRLSANDNGRHLWDYLSTDEECRERPQTVLDKFWLGMPLVRVKGLRIGMY